MAGFERAYTVTFAASLLALALGIMLPGWPRNGWAARGGYANRFPLV